MKENYLNKELKTIKKKKTPKYIGDVDLYFPEYGKIIKSGDHLEELPIEEAERRDDFIITERRS